MPQAAPLLGQIAISLIGAAAGSVLSSLIAPAEQNTAAAPAERRAGLSFETEIGEALPVRAVLGLARAKHQFHYQNAYGDQNEYLQLVYRIGMTEHDGLHRFLVDENQVTLNGDNSDPKGFSVAEYTVEGTPYLWIKYYTGAPGQAADPELVAHANPAGRWTSAHKLTGWAYLIVTLRRNEDLFGASTVPKFGSVWRGVKVYDWREPSCIWGDPSTYVYRDNAGVLSANWRLGFWVNGVRVLGMGYPFQFNDWSYYTAAANRCDESFYDPETDTTFPIFTYGRQVGDDEDKLAVQAEFEAAWCGSSFKRGGAYAPLVAQQSTPVMTLTEADLHQKADGTFHAVMADRKGAVSSKRTIWHGQFISEDNGWALAGYEPRINTAFRTLLGGDRAEALDQPFESNQARAQLRAEIALRRQLYPGTRTATYGPKVLVLEPGDPVTVACEWGSVPMEVKTIDPLDDRTGATLTLREWNNAIVPASGDSFVTLPADTGASAAAPVRTLMVSGLNVDGYQRSGGGGEHPFGKATWTQTTDPNVEQVMVRVWPTAGTEAVDKEDFFASARLTNKLVFGPLQPTTEYTGYAIPIRSDGRTCVPTNPFTFTTGAEIVTGVADGAIDTAALNTELKNITGAWMTTLYDRLDALSDELGDLAHTVAKGESDHQSNISGLLTRSEDQLASVRRLEETILGPDGALAQLQEEVTTISHGTLSGAGIRFRSQAGIGGATSQIVIEAYAETLDAWSSTGTIWQVMADGSSRTVTWADQIVWTDGSEFAVPAVFEGSVLYLNEINVKLISSPDGQSFIDMYGTTGVRLASPSS